MKYTIIFTVIILIFAFALVDLSINGEKYREEAAKDALPPHASNFVCEKPGWYSFTLGDKKFNMHQTREEAGAYNYQFIEVTE